MKLNPQILKLGRNRRYVILPENEYEELLDALDNFLADKIEADPNDPVLKWEDVRRKLIENRIAEARKKRKLTQRELARRLKVKPSTVSRLEKKSTRPRLDTLKKVAKALRCSVHDLI
jgi:putative transcriptional regulator